MLLHVAEVPFHCCLESYCRYQSLLFHLSISSPSAVTKKGCYIHSCMHLRLPMGKYFSRTKELPGHRYDYLHLDQGEPNCFHSGYKCINLSSHQKCIRFVIMALSTIDNCPFFPPFWPVRQYDTKSCS